MFTITTYGLKEQLLRYFSIAFIIAGFAFAAPPVEADSDDSALDIVQRYVEQSRNQESVLRGLHMDMDINASLPKLKKTGTLHALRQISKVGQITYQGLKFIGDNTIKNDVIVRYLRAESETQNVPRMSITPENYKFKFKGSHERDGQRVYVFNLTPRKKMVGLFKGELWVDSVTYLPVREQGKFVKNPSVFLKKVEFVREYEIRDGVAFPKHIESSVDTRFWGKAEMSINFSNYSREEEHAAVVSGEPVAVSH